VKPSLLISELRQAFDDWDGLLVNPRYCRHDNLICWSSFNGGRVKESVTSNHLLEILENRQFSFQCAEDGSIFQFLYKFDDNEELTKARLAFYLIRSRGSLEEGTAEIKSTAWVRMDFDRDGARGMLHSACHLHLHGFPEGRIIVDGIPGPRQFVEFIVASCYPDYYRVHRLDGENPPQTATIEKINSCTLPLDDVPAPILHIALPKTRPIIAPA
jgi:hypothetical protein